MRLQVPCDNSWGSMDVQLKRHHDLIPNVMKMVKGCSVHERGTLDSVVTVRPRAMAAQGPAAKADGILSEALKSLVALAEAYPQVRAVEAFTQFYSILGQVDEAIQSARRYYHAVVRD